MENELIKHMIYLQRYGSGLNKEVTPTLKKLRKELYEKVALATLFELARIKGFLKEIDLLVDGKIEVIKPKIIESMQQLGEYESTFATKLLDNSIIASVTLGTTISPEIITTMLSTAKISLDNKPPMTIDELIGVFSDRIKTDVKATIQSGLLTGTDTLTIAKSIKDLTDTRTMQQAKALILTVANFVGNESRVKVWEDNGDLLQGLEHVSVLDNRTTANICGVRDGALWDFKGEGLNAKGKMYPFKRPPLHYGCRSILVPKIKAEYDLGIDTTRAMQGGTTSSSTTYSDWLKKQPKSVIDNILGVKKSELFRSGKLTLDSFVDSKGNTLTLEELKKKDML